MAELIADERGIRLACPSCGQTNRLPYDRLAEHGRCGKCQTSLPPPAVPVEVATDAAYRALIERSSLPVLVDYWAPWCAPCLSMAPEIEKVAAAQASRLLVAKVNTEELSVVGQREGIASIPTIAVFSGGRALARTAGARPAAAIEAFVRDAVERQ